MRRIVWNIAIIYYASSLERLFAYYDNIKGVEQPLANPEQDSPAS